MFVAVCAFMHTVKPYKVHPNLGLSADIWPGQYSKKILLWSFAVRTFPDFTMVIIASVLYVVKYLI